MQGFWTLVLFSPLIVYGLYHSLPMAATSHSLLAPQSPRPLRLFIGVLTTPEKYCSRHFMRLVYGTQPSIPRAVVDVRFVLCRLTSDEQKVMVSLEILQFKDVIVLNCTENLNSGKTHTFFSSLPSILPSSYDYVLKSDDDAYVRVPELVAALEPLSRRDLYFGYAIPCASMDPYVGYMAGLGYALSWDLVEWIASSEVPLKYLVGPEDMMVGRWLDNGKKAKHRHTAKPFMYDFPGDQFGCPGELLPETIIVHHLKTTDRWMTVLKFFNVTAALPLSPLYVMERE